MTLLDDTSYKLVCFKYSSSTWIVETVLNLYPGFDHIQNLKFTWNMSNLIINIPVCIILILSRFLIIFVIH